MAQGKQAKLLTDAQVRAVLAHVDRKSRNPERDRLIVLLSVKAGMRAKEISCLTWPMVTASDGQLADVISLEDRASKGRNGGRVIPLHRDLKTALVTYKSMSRSRYGAYVLKSERGSRLTAASLANWFHRLYCELGYEGCSSHSGRRTFITKTARKIVEAGGSLRDVQELAGHQSLQTTQRYIAGDSLAKRKVVDLI